MKKLYTLYLIFFTLFNSLTILADSRPQDYCIIVHGTYAQNLNWHQLGGYFFDIIEKKAQEWPAHVIPFNWSGANNDEARERASQNLALWMSILPANARIHCIAHSHGVNICIRAAQLLKEQNKPHTIESLMALGSPINMQLYAPEYEKIKKLYNFFSYKDYVQPVYGYLPDREFPAHPQCANIRTFLCNEQPNHTQLHSSKMAYLLMWMLKNTTEYPNLFDGKDRWVNFSYFKLTPLTFHEDNLRPLLALHDRQHNHYGPTIAARVVYENMIMDALCNMRKSCTLLYQDTLEHTKQFIARKYASLVSYFKKS